MSRCRTAIDAESALAETEAYWLDWADACAHRGDYHEEIHQSLLVLKALTYAPTGGIVAAPTTSLPEWIGGVRNWDYRYCWLRDATLTLVAMLQRRLPRRGEGLARVAAARGRRRSRPTCRSCTASPASGGSTSASCDWLPGLRGIAAGTGRQRRLDAAPARRLRRGDGRRATRPGARHRAADDRSGR